LPPRCFGPSTGSRPAASFWSATLGSSRRSAAAAYSPISSSGSRASIRRTSGGCGAICGSCQILSPHRGELHGVESLNEACQTRIAENLISRIGAVDGITLFDKVIQVRNRPKSNPIWAYKASTREKLTVEAYNGEIGIAQAFGFDRDIWKTLKTGRGPRLKRFAVQFTRKPEITVGYGRDVPHGGKFTRSESVEENLELAYAVSIRARHQQPSGCAPARKRPDPQINSSLFALHVAKPALHDRRSWYEPGKSMRH
jgi:exodeoxyribonuclease V alpha subunit